MQERSIQAPPSRTADGFQSRSPRAAGRAHLYAYVVSMDDVRYHITLRKTLAKTNTRADLMQMQEKDFSEVSREGRQISPGVFLSAYARFSDVVGSEPFHTIEIYSSVASL